MVDSTSADKPIDAETSQDLSDYAQERPESDSAQESQQTKPSQIPQRMAQSNTTRPMATTPSSSVLQRALASQRQTASLDGVLEGTIDRSSKNDINSPSWPTSPRLKSPPPSTSRNNGTRKDGSENVQSNTTRKLAPVSAPELAAAMLLPEVVKDQSQAQASSHLRVPTRGIIAPSTGLETVVEGSVPTTPSLDPKQDPAREAFPDLDTRSEASSIMNAAMKDSEPKMDPPPNRSTLQKTDSELQKSRAASISRPAGNLAKRSFTSLTGNKKVTAEPVRTMTIETEQVSATTPGLGDRVREGGSVRTKTSTETIRPKKEKKRPARKPVHAGGVTSRADIFEAKVASAVDEADSSDSDETFVYESNPPEPRAPYRHHSRTPSATSLASTHDHYRGSKMRNGSTAVPGKKSMKFSNSIHTREFEDDFNRSSTRITNPTPRHHHIGRYGRNNPSLFNDDSSFNQARQPLSPRNMTGSIKSPRPGSPRVGNRVTSPRKYGGHAYDNNEDAADDERIPLIGTVRVKPSRHSRRPHSRDFRDLAYEDEIDQRWRSRWTGYCFLVFLFVVICSGVAAFVIAVNRPLLDVEIRRIQNVLASEQELMLDLDVQAVNPNLFAVTVTDLDVNLFAESPYVSSTARDQPRSGLRLTFTDRRMSSRSWFWPDPPPHADEGVDEGTDPDDQTGVQKMLLGRVSEFDSPLTFDPEPFRHSPSSSVGEIRLTKPGNKTEVDGSERWERVLLHDFDLIVRGVIKYQLPFSSKTRTAKVGARKTVHPSGEERMDT